MSNIKSKIPLAIPFKLHNDEYNDNIAEFNIRFNKEKNSFDNLIDFVQTYPNHRINISSPGEVHMPSFTAINAIHPNIYFRLDENSLTKIPELRDNNLNFFLDSHFSAYNFSTLESFINLGVSDLYISDDLCYNLKEVKRICDNSNINLRLILNRVPSTTLDRGINPSSPFFRPQDIDLLSKYFKSYEFDCYMADGTYNWNIFGVLYRAWFEHKNWHGQLGEINPDIRLNFNNETIIPDFTSYKLNCGRRCCTRLSNPCKKCSQFLDIGRILEEKNVHLVTKDKNGQEK